MPRRSLLLIPLFAALVALSAADPAPAQDEKKAVLRWYGHSFFQLEVGNQLIVFDPNAIAFYGRPVVDATLVLVSHEHADHNQWAWLKDPKVRRIHGLKADGKRLDWNKVDEKVGLVRVRTVGTYHDAVNGMRQGKNAVFVVETDGLVVCHLGDLGHELTDEQVKAIGPVDVLMVPIGGVATINGEVARKVVAQIKPRLYVLPMHYGVPGFEELLGPDEFLEGQKPEAVKKMPETNELVIPVGMKAPDAPTVVLLGWEKKEAPKK
jgi:L-ascorbate metabolism protein UlaG (beta-lactamase superfamily)